jgi:hypothetical protein
LESFCKSAAEGTSTSRILDPELFQLAPEEPPLHLVAPAIFYGFFSVKPGCPRRTQTA